MLEFLSSILGTYTPVSYQVYDAAAEEWYDVIPAGLAGVDWLYVISGFAFVVVVYCVLKCIGGLLCKIS